MTLLLAFSAAVVCAAGTYLLLQRQLSRIVVGVALLGNGANLLFILGAGRRGSPAFHGDDADEFLDPLPQALVLTAIVITFGVIAFLLTLAYRSWVLTGRDDVEDDVEDLVVARRARRAAAREPRADEIEEHFDATVDARGDVPVRSGAVAGEEGDR